MSLLPVIGKVTKVKTKVQNRFMRQRQTFINFVKINVKESTTEPSVKVFVENVEHAFVNAENLFTMLEENMTIFVIYKLINKEHMSMDI